MSSTTVSTYSSKAQVVSSDTTPSSSTGITTTAKSVTTTVTTSAKKSRKLEQPEGSTNFLPIAPHQTFFAPNQGLTLASVHQQQSLQSGGMAVFSSPTMMQQQGGPQGGQQLVVTGPGQHLGPTFNTANGQGLIQTGPGMGMIQGLQGQMQMIQAGPGQPTYTVPIQMYPGMHNMSFLGQNFMFQQNPQQLAIQIPNGNGGSTMITTNQLTANTPTTPVKPHQQGQTIIKGVTISPQQPQATKSSATTTPTGIRGQGQQNQQQQTPTFIQNQTFQTNQPNQQAFVIGTFQSSGQANGILPPNNRKNTGTARSSGISTLAPKVSGPNIIKQIQPATSLATSPIITGPAQFKSNTSPFQTASNAGSPANGQTIMVHGQGIPSGAGGIQLGHNQTILAPFPTLQPNQITWTTGPSLNQQAAQLVAAGPNGQPIFIRSPSGEQQMLIQTSNNQYQALPMQMAQQTQQQGVSSGTMQMTSNGQSMVASSMNQTLTPIIQTNQSMASTTIVTQQAAAVTSAMNSQQQTSTATSQGVGNLATTPVTNASRQRAIRPAGNAAIVCNSGPVKKVSLDSRAATANIGIAKIAPKSSPVTNVGPQTNTSRPSLVGSNVKLPLTMTKAGESAKSHVASTGVSTLVSSTTNKAVPLKFSTATAIQSSTTTLTTSAVSVSSTVASTVITTSGVTLVNNVLSSQPSKSASPLSKQPTQNRKVEKKDSATGVATCNTMGVAVGVNKGAKVAPMNGIRTSTGGANKPITSTTLAPNTQMINGVLCQKPAQNSQLKSPMVNGTIKTNGAVSKSVGINVQKGLSTPKSKPKVPENVVLTHVIDGYVIKESPNPFPINDNSNETEKDNTKEKNGSTATEDAKVKSESKENALNSSNGKTSETTLFNGVGSANEASTTMGGGLVGLKIAEQGTATGLKPKVAVGCLVCGKKEMAKNGKVKRYCSTACQNVGLEKPDPPKMNGQRVSFPIGSVQPTVPISPKMLPPTQIFTNSIISIQPQMPVAAATMPILPPGQPLVANFTNAMLPQQQLAGLKRPLNAKEPNADVPDKKVRPNSPVAAKNDNQHQTDKTKQNGVPEAGDLKESEPHGLAECLEGLWLPGSGKCPNKWTVQDVFDFISNLEGCAEFAEDFLKQEIDGQALMFIKEDHIINILHMKLGPALKICRKIKDLKSAFNL